MNNKLKIFVPGHITGFFEIINNENPLLKGSRGAGITLDEGVVTETSVCEGNGRLNVTINGVVNELNTISRTCVDIILKRYNLDISCYDININHDVSLPIAAGFGTSAAFALGISFTLPRLLGVNISFKEAGDIAHLTEISQSSGLGDVICELYGGCVMRLKEGSPSNASIDKINITRPIYVISKSIGLLETREIIENPHHHMMINKSGSILLDALRKNPSIENFIKLSRTFSQKTELISNELYEILEIFDEESIGSSMAMLGNTAFSLSYTPDTNVEKCNITKINTTGVEFKNK